MLYRDLLCRDRLYILCIFGKEWFYNRACRNIKLVFLSQLLGNHRYDNALLISDKPTQNTRSKRRIITELFNAERIVFFLPCAYVCENTIMRTMYWKGCFGIVRQLLHWWLMYFVVISWQVKISCACAKLHYDLVSLRYVDFIIICVHIKRTEKGIRPSLSWFRHFPPFLCAITPSCLA